MTPEAETVAVVGVGAIGGVCAASLVAAGRRVLCCVRTPFTDLVLESRAGVQRFAVEVVRDAAGLRPAPWVLLATKAHETESAAPWLAALLGPGSRLAVLQNGVEHVERLTRWIDRARIVAVVVACPATPLGPGHVLLRGSARLTVPDDEGGSGFADLFAGSAVTVERTPDWRTAAWRKLVSNVTGGALAALAGAPVAEVRHPLLPALALGLAVECATVARAEGADVPDGFAATVAADCLGAPPTSVPSTLTDRRRGRPLEVDARNGAVVRIGARHGIPVALNTRAAELLATAHLHPTTDLLPRLAEVLPT